MGTSQHWSSPHPDSFFCSQEVEGTAKPHLPEVPFREYLDVLAALRSNSRFDTGKYTYIFNSRAAATMCKLAGGGGGVGEGTEGRD